MKDLRIEKLAKNLIEYSVKLKKGQTVVIESTAEGRVLVAELVRQVHKLGAFPIVRLGDETVSRAVMMGLTEELSKKMLKYTAPIFEDAQAMISICAVRNEFENADVPQENKIMHSKFYGKPIHKIIDDKKINWCLLNFPNESQAQLANQSLEKFTDFFFDVCTMDYGKMHAAMIPLKSLMEKTDAVHIVAPETDLTFSIKGQIATICSGSHNIPDGEIMTTPVRNSVNGTIKFNTPLSRNGLIFNDVALTFKDGKVIKATCASNETDFNKVLDSDEGARYTGEFAFGVNPFITKPMNDTLFDEKIGGSIHMALGKAFEENCANGNPINESQIHWDIVQQGIGTGCEIYFDGVLIRKNGKFVLKELQALEKLR